MSTADLIKIEMKRRRTHRDGLTQECFAEAIAVVIDRRLAELEERLRFAMKMAQQGPDE